MAGNWRVNGLRVVAILIWWSVLSTTAGDIYERHPADPASAGEAGVQHLRVNGVPVRLATGRATPMAGAPDWREKVNEAPAEPFAAWLDDLQAAVRGRTPLWVKGGGWEARTTLGLLTAPELAAKAGSVVDLRLNPAVEQAGSSWRLEFPPGVSLRSLAARDAEEDAPGHDAPGLARFPGGRRRLTVDLLDGPGQASVHVFSGGGSLEAHLAHFHQAAHAAGIVWSAKSGKPGQARWLGRSGAGEWSLTVSSGESGATLDVITYRGAGQFD